MIASKDNEVLYIYATIRRLKPIYSIRNRTGIQSIKSRSFPDDSLFPRRFLYKLLDDRLSILDELASKLVTRLFLRLDHVDRGSPQENHNEQFTLTKSLLRFKCPTNIELDEYFHYSIHFLRDFFLELDWPNTNLEPNTEDLRYVQTRLKRFHQFVRFQKIIGSQILKNPPKNDDQKLQKKVKDRAPVSAKSFRSNLSKKTSSRVPSRGRKVTFTEASPRSQLQDDIVSGGSDKDIQENHNIFALDLMLYAINIFTRRLCDKLMEWNELQRSKLSESSEILMKSKQKIQTKQLSSICRQFRMSNHVYLSILGLLTDIRAIYLIEHMLKLITPRESKASLATYQRKRIDLFVRIVIVEVEKKIVAKLAEQCLQILLDLTVCEINLPPIDMNVETRSRSSAELNRGRDNYLNFIISWLNVDNIFHGLMGTKRSIDKIHGKMSASEIVAASSQKSTLSNGPHFKSSSRILAQMDNLNEMMRFFLNEICDGLKTRRLVGYFLEILLIGLEQFFVANKSELQIQIDTCQRNSRTSFAAGPNSINIPVDSISVKIRCLKFIHILSSINRLISEIGERFRFIPTEIDDLEERLAHFIEQCNQTTGSNYKS